MFKTFVISILLICLLSCGTRDINYIVSPEGKIIHIEKDDEGVMVEVAFSQNNDNIHQVSFWFQGSDTCKVGQIIKLR